MHQGERELSRTRAALVAMTAIVTLVIVAGALWLHGRDDGAPPAAAPPAAAPTDNPTDNPLRPGKWEVTVKLPGKVSPGQPPGPFVDQQCLDEQSPTPRGHVPPGCRSYDVKWSGAELDWRIRCTGARQGDGAGKATISDGGGHLEGKLIVWLPSLITGLPQRHDQLVSGRWLGPCD